MDEGPHTCEKCGKSFRVPAHLKRHYARKTPCDPILEPKGQGIECRYCGKTFASRPSMNRHIKQYCKIANSEEGMEKLMEHTLARQNRELTAKIDGQSKEMIEIKAQVSRLTNLIEKQLAPRIPGDLGRPAPVVVEATTQINTGPVTNNTSNTSNTTVNQIIQIMPWDGDRRIAVGIVDVVKAFAENARLKEYARLGDHELTDPNIAPPYVTELFMDLTKRAHTDPTSRNVYLNPRRADQALVHMTTGKWEVVSLVEATRLLFDGVAASAHKIVQTYAEICQLPIEAQNALSMAGLLYDDEPDEYARRAKGPMSAHLANTKPLSPAGDRRAMGVARHI